MYIKLRQIQTQEIEFSRDMEELLAIFPNDEDEDSYIEKNTDLPWKALFNEETLEMAARGNSVYFAENNLNNIIITDKMFDRDYTLINYIRKELFDILDDDDDFYKVLYNERDTSSRDFIVVKEHNI